MFVLVDVGDSRIWVWVFARYFRGFERGVFLVLHFWFSGVWF